MPDYSKTTIYKIFCNDLNVPEIYVGSTCSFINRKYGHKSNCHNEHFPGYNFKVYKFIRANGGWENWEMVIIDEQSVENKYQKENLEREWIESLGSTLNTQIPNRTKQEYNDTHREEIKQYYLKNRDNILLHKKEKINCECGGRYTRTVKARHLKCKKHLKNTLQSLLID
tara:strand:+ start:685 stop:1194 length:510 start_codon:yes stop_codon:yes gene_type:complete